MSVAGLAIDAISRKPIVLLRDLAGSRQVPIWIDHAQAHNIMVGFKQTSQSVPLSHDLMIEIMKVGKLSLDRVIIYAIEDSTFQAQLKISIDNGQLQQESSIEITQDTLNADLIVLDVRPSDAIALALRTKCSIWMHEEVVAEASIPVDVDADKEDQDDFHRFVDQLSPAEMIKHLKDRDMQGEDPIDSSGAI